MENIEDKQRHANPMTEYSEGEHGFVSETQQEAMDTCKIQVADEEYFHDILTQEEESSDSENSQILGFCRCKVIKFSEGYSVDFLNDELYVCECKLLYRIDMDEYDSEISLSSVTTVSTEYCSDWSIDSPSESSEVDEITRLLSSVTLTDKCAKREISSSPTLSKSEHGQSKRRRFF